jgi:hypothetical protein
VNHPNAAAAATTGGLATFVVWLSGNVFHWSLSAEDGAIIAGAVATVVLFIGRNGLKGLWRKIWNGQEGGADTLLLLAVAILIVVVLTLWKVW